MAGQLFWTDVNTKNYTILNSESLFFTRCYCFIHTGSKSWQKALLLNLWLFFTALYKNILWLVGTERFSFSRLCCRRWSALFMVTTAAPFFKWNTNIWQLRANDSARQTANQKRARHHAVQPTWHQICTICFHYQRLWPRVRVSLRRHCVETSPAKHN